MSLISHFDTQAQAHAPAPRVECRFDDDGDDGGHANRAALVFQSPKDLVNCFEALENDGRLVKGRGPVEHGNHLRPELGQMALMLA